MPRRRLAIVAAIALVIAGGGWFATRSSSKRGPDGTGRAGSAGRTPAEAHLRGSAAPGWIAQPGAGARHVAGRVSYAGAPASGATVTMTSPLTNSGLVPPVTATTGADGRFDLGPQDAARIAIAAAMPGKTAAVLDLDLRDPTLRPSADAIELVLRDCAASVYGTVLDAGGGPIGGAQVRRGPVAAITADDGAFELCVPVGDTTLQVGADGYGAIVVRVSAFARLHRDVRLSPEAIIAGRTVREDGSPVAGAVVRLAATPEFGGTGEVPGAAAETTSDADGGFRFAGVAAGRRQLTAAADGLRTSGSTDVAVEPGAPGDDEVLLTLAAAVAVAGTVVDEADKPIAGATVSIALGDDSVRETATALSQADGTFVVDGVAPGVRDVGVDPYRFADRGMRRQRVTVPPTGVADLKLTVSRGSSVSGVVTRRGAPVEGAGVSLRDGGRATTITDGSFVLRGIDPGDHQFYAESLEDGAFTSGPTITVVAGADLTGVAIELDLAGAISGVVVDQNGAPVPGVFLSFNLRGGRDYGRSTTATDGTFVVRALSGGGDYDVLITPSRGSSQRFASATGDELAPVSVPDGNAQIQGVRYAIRVDRLSIAGRVVDDQGNPVPDVRVEARPLGRGFVMDPASDVTGVDGAFAITNLLAATYRVAARAGGGGEATPSEVEAGTRGLRLVLAAPGEIEGTLAGFPTPPRVVARALGGERMSRDRMSGVPRGDASAAVQGTTFRLRGLAPGAYRVIALVDGLAAEQVEVTITSRATARATLTFRGLGSITGTVTDAATQAPIAGARCMLFSARRNDIRTDAQGRFTIDPAPVGRATVMCRSEDGKNGRGDAEVAAGQQASMAIAIAEPKPPAPQATMGATFASSSTGPRVATVTPGGPAATAGVNVDDVVTALEGFDAPFAEVDGQTMTRIVSFQPPGTVLKLKLKRGSATVDASVTLAAP